MIESVINFMSRNTASNIMKFDVVKGESTFKQAVVDTLDDVISVIPSAPINTVTKEISVGDEAKKFQQTIAGITFPNGIPSVDYNHEGIAQYANGASINSGWSNAGTEGSAYVLSTFAGTCNAITDAGESTLILSLIHI